MWPISGECGKHLWGTFRKDIVNKSIERGRSSPSRITPVEVAPNSLPNCGRMAAIQPPRKQITDREKNVYEWRAIIRTLCGTKKGTQSHEQRRGKPGRLSRSQA